MKKLAYMGPLSFSEVAAKNVLSRLSDRIDETVELIPLPTTDSVSDSLMVGDVDYALLPYRNNNDGMVRKTLDMIYLNSFEIVGMERLPVEISIGRFDSYDGDIIYSHQKAFGQAKRWLNENMPGHKEVYVPHTGYAIEEVNKLGKGYVLGHPQNLRDSGLEIIEDGIENHGNDFLNYTDFFLVDGKQNQYMDKDKKYMTMLAVNPYHNPDDPGLLDSITSLFKMAKINMNDLMPRPPIGVDVSDAGRHRMFYIEAETHRSDRSLELCIELMRHVYDVKNPVAKKDPHKNIVKVMGSYEAP